MSAAEAAPMLRIALTATAAERIGFEFFMAASNGDSYATKPELKTYASATSKSLVILGFPTEFGRSVQDKRAAPGITTGSSRPLRATNSRDLSHVERIHFQRG